MYLGLRVDRERGQTAKLASHLSQAHGGRLLGGELLHRASCLRVVMTDRLLWRENAQPIGHHTQHLKRSHELNRVDATPSRRSPTGQVPKRPQPPQNDEEHPLIDRSIDRSIERRAREVSLGSSSGPPTVGCRQLSGQPTSNGASPTSRPRSSECVVWFDVVEIDGPI